MSKGVINSIVFLLYDNKSQTILSLFSFNNLIVSGFLFKDNFKISLNIFINNNNNDYNEYY